MKIARKPMPSPQGTNRAGLYLPRNFAMSTPAGAYDEAPDDPMLLLQKVLGPIRGSIPDETLQQVTDLMKKVAQLIEEGRKVQTGEDPGAGRIASDRALRQEIVSASIADFRARFPNAARIQFG